MQNVHDQHNVTDLVSCEQQVCLDIGRETGTLSKDRCGVQEVVTLLVSLRLAQIKHKKQDWLGWAIKK